MKNYCNITNQHFYKITNDSDTHFGFVYKIGRNDLNEKFEKNGSGVQGGLYFTTGKHIFKYLHIGNYLRRVSLPRDCEWVQDPDMDKFRSNSIILEEKQDLTNFDTFKKIVENHDIDIHAGNDDALKWASRKGYFEIVEYLVQKGANVNASREQPLNNASEYGHYQVVEYLLKCGAKPTHFSLMSAINEKNHKMVKCLIKHGVDFRANNDIALEFASFIGDLPIVECLLDNGCNIHSNNDIAFRVASENGHLNVVHYLKEKMTM